MNIIKRFVRSIRSAGRKSTSKRTNKKQNRTKSKSVHKGGAIYGYNLTDKIGGQAARIPLNGTQDGDCPDSNTTDLGFTNYGLTRGGGCVKKQKHKKRCGGVKKTKKNKSSKKSKCNVRKSKK